MSKTQKIEKYMREVISFLDGQGIIITDWDLVEQALCEFGEFEVLKGIIMENEDDL